MSCPLPDLTDYSLVLGTTSKYRLALFRTHFPTLPFTTASPSIDEGAITAGYTERATAPPSDLTLAIAHAKASAILPTLPPNALLITSDQVLSHNNRIREKPSSPAECRRYLASYAAHPVVTVTAIVVTHAASGRCFEGVDVATQHLHPLPDDVITALITKGDVLHCAGGITIEDDLVVPYHGARTGTLESIMGLPLSLTRDLLCEAAAAGR